MDPPAIQSAYRFLLADLMPFGKNAIIRLEHGGENESTEHYETITYWYGRPGASLVQTDELKVGDPASEATHRYESPQASAPYEIVSRYELGPDTSNPTEKEAGNAPPPAGITSTVSDLYPAHLARGRKTTGTSEFTLRLDPKNQGVMLGAAVTDGIGLQSACVMLAIGAAVILSSEATRTTRAARPVPAPRATRHAPIPPRLPRLRRPPRRLHPPPLPRLRPRLRFSRGAKTCWLTASGRRSVASPRDCHDRRPNIRLKLTRNAGCLGQ